MKPDFVDDYKGPELSKTTQPLSYTALQNRLLKTSSSNDLRGQTLFAQTLSKNGRVPSPLRKFSETFKRKGFAKSGMTTMKSRNGSISSDSGEGSLSDFHTTTNELEKFSLETSGENGQETPLNKGSKKPQNLTFQKPRRFSSPATSPTRQNFEYGLQAVSAIPVLRSNLKERLNRQRGSSLPDTVVGGANRITSRNIRDSGTFSIGCLEEDDEEGQYGNDVRKCLDLTRPLSKHAKSSVLLISDQNNHELEYIELNKRLDKETLQASAVIPDEEGMTILHRAVQNGFANLAKFLVNSGVSTEMVDLQGRTALCLAFEIGNYDCAELLLRLGANINFVMKGGKTILHQMAQEGDYKAVQLLVKNGADLNLEDDKGWPALHYALKRKDLKCAALLMTSGANIHRYTEKRIQEFSMSMEIVNIGRVRMDNTQTVDQDLSPDLEVTII